jgi:hypothetical protein
LLALLLEAAIGGDAGGTGKPPALQEIVRAFL